MVKVSFTLPAELVAELQAAVAATGSLGRVGCDNKSAAVRRALRELLDRVGA